MKVVKSGKPSLAKSEKGLKGIPSNNIMKGQKSVTKKPAAPRTAVPAVPKTLRRVILHSDFDPGELEFEPMKKARHLYISNVSQGGSDVVIMTPEFELTIGGVPREGGKYDNRNYVSVALNGEFEELLEGIDDAVHDDSENIFGKSVDLETMTRVPLVRTSERDEKSFNVKLCIDFNSKNVLTKIFVKGKPVVANTVDDVAKYVTWGSTIQMLVVIDKVWASNSVFSTGGEEDQTFGVLPEPNEDARYGVTLTAMQINVVKEKEPSRRSKTLDAFTKSNVFGSA